MGKNLGFSITVEIPPNATKLLEDAAARALKTVSAELEGRFTSAINSNVWTWPRKSKRGIGGSTLSEVSRAWKAASFNVGSPRNIHDSGQLMGSLDTQLSGLNVEYKWTMDYAAAVHDGAWIQPWQNDRAKKVLLPARPWTEAVLFGHPHYNGQIYPFSDRMAVEIARQLS